MGTSQAILPVQVSKAAPHLWLRWPRASSPWRWTLRSKTPSPWASLFPASEHLFPLVKRVSQLCSVHTHTDLKAQLPPAPGLHGHQIRGSPASSCTALPPNPKPCSLASFSPQKPTWPVSKVHAFGKRGNALRRDPNLPVHIRGWLHKQVE